MSTNTTTPTTTSALPVPTASTTTSLLQPNPSATTPPATTPQTTSPATTLPTTTPPTTTTTTPTTPTTTPTTPATTAPTTTSAPPPSIVTTSQAPVTSVVESTIVTTISPSNQSPRIVTQTVTSTNVTPSVDTPATSVPSATTTSVTSTDSSATGQPISTSGGSPNGGGGLNGTTKVVVAVVVPIIGVAFVAILLLFLWKRQQKTRADAEARRKEVEEYGYNPNNDPHGGAAAVAGVGVGVARSNSNGEETLYEMTESDGAGYRGWGSTNGGRKASNMGSSVGTSVPMSPVGMAFSDGGFPQQQGNIIGSGPDGYTGVATSPSASTFPVGNSPSVDGSNAPLIHGNRPTTADSSVIGAMNGPITAENSGGIHRGISNASSNYSAMTQSDQSDVGQPISHHDAQYYGVDDGYEDAYYSSRNPANPYSGDGGYGPAPVIRDVSARRNTRIETPTSTHFPQQGNSGIAQNF